MTTYLLSFDGEGLNKEELKRIVEFLERPTKAFPALTNVYLRPMPTCATCEHFETDPDGAFGEVSACKLHGGLGALYPHYVCAENYCDQHVTSVSTGSR